MPSLPRNKVVIPGCYYHAYARGNNKRTIFLKAADYLIYLRLLRDAARLTGVEILNYCLMPNHLHFIFVAGDRGISKCLQRVQMLYTRYFNKKYGRTGTIWQCRPKTKLIESDEYFAACGEYIENNPVRAGLVSDAADWPYSTASNKCEVNAESDSWESESGHLKLNTGSRIKSRLMANLKKLTAK